MRLGFSDVERAEGLLGDDFVARVLGASGEGDDLLGALAGTADPDLALLGLVRLGEAVRGDAERRGALESLLSTSSPARARLLAVLGGSTALADNLVFHPENVDVLTDDEPGVGLDPAVVRSELLRAVGAEPGDAVPVAGVTGPEGVDRMRRAYRRRLLRIAAADLTSPDPLALLPTVAAALADAAGAALEASLALARAALADHGAAARLCVIGMGKCGGRELNYVSDVDVIYVVEPADGHHEDEAVTVGARLATLLAAACSAPSKEPGLWAVDAALRPEGKQGPLVRTLASHRAYYERWAETWEFQALLKARPVAGDLEVGRAYCEAVNPMVWAAVERENFVPDAQAMRRRVEKNVPPGEADRQLKLGAGGLRDVEFTIQLLQLVHGRADEAIRSPTTLDALAALSEGGYVGRDHAARMAYCYRMLRAMEHRIQLFHLRRTHLLPTEEQDLRRLARSLGMRAEGADGLLERWRGVRRDVRRMHEELFYRPLLPATARLSTDEARLAPAAARARLAAIGYLDPAGALRHIAALTDGVSRRASIQRQLLPVMLGWFAEGADPDAGLLAFRTLSDTLGSTHWYLKLLRDSGVAAERLAHVLSTSAYVADALTRSTDSVTWLGDDAELTPRSPERLAAEADSLLTRADDPGQASTALRAMRRRELARTAAADVLGVCSSVTAADSLTATADVLVVGGLRIALVEAAREHGLAAPPTRFQVIAMGRFGGREMGYSSDADVMFVHDPVPGADESVAQAYALTVAAALRSLIGGAGPEPALAIDANLRPEGRNGPLVRTLASYAEYYQRWSSTWESQALLRARPVAGDALLGSSFAALIDPIRYPAGGLDQSHVREIRRLKARMESERLPRGVDPARHLKLGRGGLSDVEWTIQLIQLQHAAKLPSLRTTATLEALSAAEDAGLIDPGDAEVLADAWRLASRLRAALVLRAGRTSGADADVLPHDLRALAALARLLGRESGSGAELDEDYLRTSRRARAVVERIFYA